MNKLSNMFQEMALMTIFKLELNSTYRHYFMIGKNLYQALSLFLVLMVLQEILLKGERVAFTNNPDTWVYRATLHHL